MDSWKPENLVLTEDVVANNLKSRTLNMMAAFKASKESDSSFGDENVVRETD